MKWKTRIKGSKTDEEYVSEEDQDKTVTGYVSRLFPFLQTLLVAFIVASIFFGTCNCF
jgi:hypothetical protein